MSTVTLPPLVNDQGNINIHIHEGGVIPVSTQDEFGADVDATGLPLFFICGNFRKALGPSTTDPTDRVVELTPADLTSITHGAAFRVVDESNPQIPINRWEGKIYKRG